MPLCKEFTSAGKKCKNYCINEWEICWQHSPTCSICLDKLVVKQTQTLHCGHEFHHECIEKWIEKNNTCPFCRDLTDHCITLDSSLNPSDVTRDFTAQLMFGMMNLPLPPKRVLVKLDENKKVLFLIQ